MLSTYGTPSDIIDNVSIDARPIDCLSCLCLYLLFPLVCAVEVSRGTVKEVGRDAVSVSLQENTSLNGQLI